MVLNGPPALRLRFSLLHMLSCAQGVKRACRAVPGLAHCSLFDAPGHPNYFLAKYRSHGRVSRRAERYPGPARRPAMLVQKRRSRKQVSLYNQYVTPSYMVCNKQDCAGGAERPFLPISHRDGPQVGRVAYPSPLCSSHLRRVPSPCAPPAA